jgi:hypothetical protein
MYEECEDILRYSEVFMTFISHYSFSSCGTERKSVLYIPKMQDENFMTSTHVLGASLHYNPYLYHVLRTLKTSFRRLVFQAFKLQVVYTLFGTGYDTTLVCFSHLLRMKMCI